MRQADCVEFLQWCLPRLHMRWPGFRKVRSQVCKRIRRRLTSLALDELEAYQRYLETHADEWPHLDAMCRITISRFYRDRGVFEALETEVLPALATAARRRALVVGSHEVLPPVSIPLEPWRAAIPIHRRAK